MNFSFLYPYFLWALPLAGLPIILHLLFKKKPKLYRFSYLHFINLATRQNVPHSRLKNYLLLFVRCLILLILTILFSRPVLHFGDTFKKKKELSRSFVILIDNSYSMGFQVGDRNYFEYVKDSSRELINNLSDSDRAAVVVFSNRVEFASGQLTNDKQLLQKKVSEIKLSNNPTDITSAFDVASRLLKNTQTPSSVIIVFSDFAKHGWKRMELSKAFERKDDFYKKVKLIFVDHEYEVKNMAIFNIELKGDYYNEDANVIASIINFDNTNVNPGMSIYWNGVKKLEGVVELKKKEYKKKVFQLRLPEKQIVDIEGRLNVDGLALDNKYYFTKSIKPVVNILIIDGDPKLSTVDGESFFLQHALTPKTGLSGIRAKITGVDEASGINMRDYDLLISCNVGSLRQEMADKLDAYLQQGGRLLITLGNNTKVDLYKSLKPLMPAEIVSHKALSKGESIELKPTAHPLLKKLELQDSYEMGLINFTQYYFVRPMLGSRVVLSLANGHPLLVERNIGSGSSMLFCSTVDRDWTNFPVKPLYPIFFQEIARYLTQDKKTFLKKVHWIIGESLTSKHIDYKGNVSSISLIDPDKSRNDISKLLRNYQEVIFDVPGIYYLEYNIDGKKIIEGLDVNLDQIESEGNFEKISSSEIQDIFPKIDVSRLVLDKQFIKKLLIMLNGKEVSKYFFWILLSLLLVETLLANPRQKKAKYS
ncbi:MAG: VWA domain-containing protein [bacterium]